MPKLSQGMMTTPLGARLTELVEVSSDTIGQREEINGKPHALVHAYQIVLGITLMNLKVPEKVRKERARAKEKKK